MKTSSKLALALAVLAVSPLLTQCSAPRGIYSARIVPAEEPEPSGPPLKEISNRTYQFNGRTFVESRYLIARTPRLETQVVSREVGFFASLWP